MIRLRHRRCSGASPGATVLLALLALAACFGFLQPRDASAHAVLLETSPAAGSVVAESPTEIVLLFSEPVRILDVAIIGADLRDMAPSVPANAVDGRVVLPLPQPLPDGRYLVGWHIGSLDGHALRGSFLFAVGEDSGAYMSARVFYSDGASRWIMVAVRALSRLLLFFAAGMALFRVALTPPALLDARLDRWIRRFAVGAYVALLALIGVEGALRTALGLPGFFAASAWRAAIAEPTIGLHLVSLIGLVSLVLVPRGAIAAVGALASFATLATAGHVLTHLPLPVGQALMIGHGIAAAMWLGAIAPLRASLATADTEATAALFRRFHSVAIVVVALVLASGIVMAWALLPRLSDLWTSDYGLRLCAKLAAVAAMLIIAGVNRFWLTKHALAGVPALRARLRRLLGLDLIAATLAIVLAAGLSFGPPPLASLRTTLVADHYELSLELMPGRAGDNDVTIALTPLHGGPVDPMSVTLRAGSIAAGIEPMAFDSVPLSPGLYGIEAVPLWAEGVWQIELDILVDDFTRVRARTEIELPR